MPDTPLRRAEDQLQVARARIAAAAGFINDDTYDIAARIELAHRMGLPGPATAISKEETSGAR